MKKIKTLLAAAVAALSLTYTGVSATAVSADYSGYIEQSVFGDDLQEQLASPLIIENQEYCGLDLVSDAAAQTDTEIAEEDSSQSILKKILISLAAGVIIALIVCMIMKSMMKTANPKNTANDYIRKNSFNITRSRDIFIYANVTKKKRVKEEKK